MTLLRNHLRAGRATSVLVALVVAATVFVVALAPRALVRLGTDELRHELRAQPSQRVDLSGTGPVTLGPGFDATSLLGPIDGVVSKIRSRLDEPLRDGAGAPQWLVRTGASTGSTAAHPEVVLSLKLAANLAFPTGVHFTAGGEPDVWAPRGPGPEEPNPEPVPIALSEASAEAIDVGVGDIITVDPVPYQVAGIYSADRPAAGFWLHVPDLLTPELIRESGFPLKIQASAFVAAGSVPALRQQFSAGELTAWIPVDPSAYRYSDAVLLGSQVRQFAATPVGMPNGGSLGFRSALDRVLTDTRARVSSISALIALSASGFIGILIAAYALCIQAVISRRRTVLSLAAARGAAPRQLRVVMLIEASLIAIPASVLAIVTAALVLPADTGPAGWIAPALVAVTPVLLAILLTGSGRRRDGRDDLSARWSGTSRWVVEVAVFALSAVALFLLQRRGLIASSAVVGIDPLLSAMPVLLAASAGLIVLRVYPAPLRAIARALRRRSAPAANVGAARAVREPAIGLIGSLALVTGMAIAVFTTIMISTVDTGLRVSAQDQIGADVQIHAHDLPATLVDAIADLPSVDAAVALVGASGVEFSDESGPSEVSVVLADTAALHQVRPDIPRLDSRVDGVLPILVSSDWVDRVDGSDLSLVNSRVRQVGVIPAAALPGITRHWVLIDSSAAEELQLGGQVPDRVLATLVAGADSPSALEDIRALVTAEQPQGFAQTVRVDDARSLLAEIRSSPVIGGLERSLLLVSLATLLLTVLIVALAALTAAASRNRVMGVLRVLGMSPRQLRTLVGWEFAPVAISAMLVGTAVGIGLPWLVTAVLDLRGFFGGNHPPVPSLDPVTVLAVVLVFGIVVAGTAVAGTLAGRRLAPAGVLKMGEE